MSAEMGFLMHNINKFRLLHFVSVLTTMLFQPSSMQLKR